MSEFTLTPEVLVSEIAARYPEVLPTLEALRIDFCCGGKRPLAQAAAEAKVPAETVVAVIQAAITQAAGSRGTERNWMQAPLADLMQHIVETHHAYLNGEMPRLERMMALVAHVHGPSHGDVLEPLSDQYGRLKGELDAHLRKEEDEVFPAVLALAAGEAGEECISALVELTREHDAAGAALAAMREVTSDFAMPEDACATYAGLYDGLQALERDIHQHIHLENNILIPRALELARRPARV